MPEPNRPEVERLIETYRPQLKSFISRRVDNKEDAEDILQDVFYQFVKTVYTTLHPIEQVAAWLYRVTRNTIINHGAKKREEGWPLFHDVEGEEEMEKEFSEVLLGGSDSPETEYLRSLVWIELEEALSELPVEQREVYEWTELEGLSMKEISQATGAPVNTLLSRKHYAVLHLRKRMRELYEELVEKG